MRLRRCVNSIEHGLLWAIRFQKSYCVINPFAVNKFLWYNRTEDADMNISVEIQGQLRWIEIVLAPFLKTLRPRQSDRYFADDTFKRIFVNGDVGISIKISLRFVPLGQINTIPTLVQIMAWRRPGDKPLSEPMMVRLPTNICATRPQWVKQGTCTRYIQPSCLTPYSNGDGLIHKSLMTPDCLVKIGSGNGLLPVRHQAIMWTNADLLTI